MPTLEARGVELSFSERGAGPSILLIHDTATAAASWDAVGQALEPSARAIAYDRRGWGASTAPDEYRRTTVEEQSEDAAALIEGLDAAPAVLCGAGIGAVIALDLLLRRPELASASVLIEPSLLSLLPEATEALSEDRLALEHAAADGREAVLELYLSGGLAALGPGAGRISEELVGPARERPGSVIAELGADATWGMPPGRLRKPERPSLVITSTASPPLLVAAADSLAARLGSSERREVDSGAALPQIGAAAEVAGLALELSG